VRSLSTAKEVSWSGPGSGLPVEASGALEGLTEFEELLSLGPRRAIVTKVDKKVNTHEVILPNSFRITR